MCFFEKRLILIRDLVGILERIAVCDNFVIKQRRIVYPEVDEESVVSVSLILGGIAFEIDILAEEE